MKTVQLKEKDKVVGHHVVVWRENRADTCVVTKIDEKEARVHYEIMTGQDKGKKFSGNYDPNQEIEVYEHGEEVIALTKK